MITNPRLPAGKGWQGAFVIKEKQPKFFVAENVKVILSLGNGTVIKQIEADFQDAGYLTSVNLVNMADFGVPQAAGGE